MARTDVYVCDALKKARCWCFRDSTGIYDPIEGKKITSSSEGRTFDEISDISKSGGSCGFAFLLRGDIVYINLKNCIDDHGRVSKPVQKILSSFPKSYAEYSEDGRGIHILTKGKIPAPIIGSKGDVEMYDSECGYSGIYCPYTGDAFQRRPPSNEQAGIDFISETYGTASKKGQNRKETAKQSPAKAKSNDSSSRSDQAAGEESRLPEWLYTTQGRNGAETKHINEPLFSKQFIEKNELHRVNGTFYRHGIVTSDDLIRQTIQSEIEPYIFEKTGRRTEDLMKTVSNGAVTEVPKPDKSKIYCADNVTLNLNDDGTVTAIREDVFSPLRLPTVYDPNADCPVFKRLVNDLFHPEDITVVQEYVGYCLIPTTEAQAGLFIKGPGGEGKTTFAMAIMNVFGTTAIQGKIHDLNRQFQVATLQNRLLFVDDDLKLELLKETGTLKQLITAQGKISIEKKGIDAFDCELFARFIALGQDFIGSKFDQSDGFYRRQLPVTVKPKTRKPEQDDPFLSRKLAEEASGILNWALSGLERLVKNGLHLSRSKRMDDLLSSVRSENDNTIDFFLDCIEESDLTDSIASVDMWIAYVLWCEENGFPIMKRTMFNAKAGAKYKGRKNKVLLPDGQRVNGYSCIRFSKYMEDRVKMLEASKRERIICHP